MTEADIRKFFVQELAAPDVIAGERNVEMVLPARFYFSSYSYNGTIKYVAGRAPRGHWIFWAERARSVEYFPTLEALVKVAYKRLKNVVVQTRR